MRKPGLVLIVLAASAVSAATYFYFEAIVHNAIHQVWEVWFDTDAERWLVLPLCLVIGLAYFATVHYLDRRTEGHEAHGLGDMPKPTILNYLKVLFIGFLSLVAGASLGPEAILVPACMIAGSYVGMKLYKNDTRAVKIAASAAFIALFAAFFHSFVIGLLSVFLVTKQAKVKLRPGILLTAAIASLTSVVILKLLSTEPYFEFPKYDWQFTLETLLAGALLFAMGGLAVLGMDKAHESIKVLTKRLIAAPWWIHGLTASLGLAALYLLGGPLVQFTGNQSIQPMFSDAAELGLSGLMWLVVVKVLSIAWSKSIGYRGGMIFPTVFIAATLTAIIGLYITDFSPIYGIIAAMAGALVADKKAKILL